MRKLVFVDRLLATPVNLRHGTTHDVLIGFDSPGLHPANII
ncbi:hypothetical protein [Streptomyces silvisoli]|uniref:Uncharacterized protein n=1 Tax=Streptomyces silvisoli TaxID=3034235 RepID=A0ABT5ZHK7_9ACTN|nr:hypothetical protein [Streptomyces silvisoli]MDF3289304.1 hypothetical protein [Streptomyces silvisoli]